jgi:predicted Zn-dependent protease
VALSPEVAEVGSATAAGSVQETKSSATVRKGPSKYDVAQIGSRSVGKGVNFYSLEKEQRLGRELASELEQQVRLLDDVVITEYVNRIGQNLVRNSDAKVPFTIKVIDDDEINALALPGGYFYVNSGLILAADNEAELAGVMAHEIAHVCARHATRSMTKGRIWNLASIPLIFVGGGAGYAIRQVVAVSVPMSFLKFSRDAEREADFLGIEYEYAAGYDPSALVQFLERINARERPQKHRLVAKLFATHPMTEDRIWRAQAEIATILPPRGQYVVTTSEFDEVKARVTRAGLSMKRKDDDGKANRPTLRRRTPQGRDPADAGEGETHQPEGEHDHGPTPK